MAQDILEARLQIPVPTNRDRARECKEPGSGKHGYQDIVDIDLKGFFDEVDHCTLLQLIYQRVKCTTTPALAGQALRLILGCGRRKWLRAPIQINGKLHRRRNGA